MGSNVTLDAVLIPSEDVVSRDIGGELIVVPIAAGIGDMEDELYALKGTGQIIWNRLDGKTTLAVIARELSEEYHAADGELEQDVIGFVEELASRSLVVQANRNGK